MALTLVATTMETAFSLASQNIRKKASLVVDVEAEVQKLTKTLQSIRAVLDNEKNNKEKEEAVKDWLSRLEELSRDIQLLLDEWAQILRSQIAEAENAPTPQKKVRQDIPSTIKIFEQAVTRRDVAPKIKELKERLDSIAFEGRSFGFKSIPITEEQPKRARSTSSVDELVVYGRDQDKETTVSELSCGSSKGERGFHIIPSGTARNLSQFHNEENPGSAPAERSDQVAIDMVDHSRKEVATEDSIRVEERSLSSVAPDNPFDVISRPEIHDRNPKVIGKRFFVIGNFLFEILGSALNQASSPNKPEFALAGLVMSLVAVIVCIIEFSWKAQRAKVTMRRWGWIWWFYHPPPDFRLFGTFVDILVLTCVILQLISSAIDFGFFHRHADNPVKISLYPVFFAACIAGLEFIKNPSELSHRASQ